MERLAETALAEARAAGLDVRVQADRLIVRGPRSSALLAGRLLEQKPDVLAILAKEVAEVGWRIDAMRPQVPRAGPVPVLKVRDVEPIAPGRCISCGDALEENHRYRCGPCAQAARVVLNEVREGVASQS